MAIQRYGVLQAMVVDFRREDHDPTPHFQLFVEANARRFRVPVNVRSQLSPSELVYHVSEDFRHPITTRLHQLPSGYTRLPETDRQGLDYIRGNLFDLERVIALPHNLPGEDNDLQDLLVSHAQSAINPASNATVWVFGEPFPSSNHANGAIEGMHDIHMNQGNHPTFRGDDGVFHDGGLIFHFPNRGRFVAIFLAFQSQALHTDDTTGHALAGARTFADVVRGTPPPPDDPRQRDRQVRLLAALINPEGGENQPGHTGRPEAVTLLNATPQRLSLQGWSLVDRSRNQHLLDGIVIEAGETVKIPLDRSRVTLGNAGGTLSLLDDHGLKVDGVSWTRDDAREGWTTVF
jgi:uncharacterized protein YukJ